MVDRVDLLDLLENTTTGYYVINREHHDDQDQDRHRNDTVFHQGKTVGINFAFPIYAHDVHARIVLTGVPDGDHVTLVAKAQGQRFIRAAFQRFFYLIRRGGVVGQGFQIVKKRVVDADLGFGMQHAEDLRRAVSAVLLAANGAKFGIGKFFLVELGFEGGQSVLRVVHRHAVHHATFRHRGITRHAGKPSFVVDQTVRCGDALFAHRIHVNVVLGDLKTAFVIFLVAVEVAKLDEFAAVNAGGTHISEEVVQFGLFGDRAGNVGYRFGFFADVIQLALKLFLRVKRVNFRRAHSLLAGPGVILRSKHDDINHRGNAHEDQQNESDIHSARFKLIHSFLLLSGRPSPLRLVRPLWEARSLSGARLPRRSGDGSPFVFVFRLLLA